jgi:hypothetical protein
VRRDSGQWRGVRAGASECGEAAWHQPSKLARVTTLRHTLPMEPSLGPVGFQAPWRARACTAVRADAARRGATSRGCARSGSKHFKVAPVDSIFLQILQLNC